MLKFPILSIIIFCNNDYEKLKKILSSFNLNDSRLEFLILNFLPEFKFEDRRIIDLEKNDNVFLYSSCKDVNSSMNLMLKIKRGKYLFLLFEDYIIEKNDIETILLLLERSKSEIVSSLCKKIQDFNHNIDEELFFISNFFLKSSYIKMHEISFLHDNIVFSLRRFFWDILSKIKYDELELVDSDILKISENYNIVNNNNIGVELLYFLCPFLNDKETKEEGQRIISLLILKSNYLLLKENIKKEDKKQLFNISFAKYKEYSKKNRIDEILKQYPERKHFFIRIVMLNIPYLRWSFVK